MALTIGCRAHPGKSRDNKTGSWRVFKPSFDHEKCSKCGTCQIICPEACISEDNEGFFDPDYAYCKGCGLCAEECPKEAIAMRQEEK
jgi:pyruvate ferredoxin oxidoreductase delta subunit